MRLKILNLVKECGRFVESEKQKSDHNKYHSEVKLITIINHYIKFFFQTFQQTVCMQSKTYIYTIIMSNSTTNKLQAI